MDHKPSHRELTSVLISELADDELGIGQEDVAKGLLKLICLDYF